MNIDDYYLQEYFVNHLKFELNESEKDVYAYVNGIDDGFCRNIITISKKLSRDNYYTGDFIIKFNKFYSIADMSIRLNFCSVSLPGKFYYPYKDNVQNIDFFNRVAKVLQKVGIDTTEEIKYLFGDLKDNFEKEGIMVFLLKLEKWATNKARKLDINRIFY